MKLGKKSVDEFWLEDADDILRHRLKQASKLPQSSHPKVAVPKNKSKEITLKVPKIRIPESVTFHIPKPKEILSKQKINNNKIIAIIFKHKKTAFLSLALIFVVAASLVFFNLKKEDKKSGSSSQPTQAAKADFTPLIPIQKKAGGQAYQGITYNQEKHIIIFTDTFQGIKIVISQQKLTGPSVKDPTTILKAAQSISAKKPVQTEKGTLYYANLPNSTIQLAVCKFNDLMIFFQTNKILEDNQWQQYINGFVSQN